MSAERGRGAVLHLLTAFVLIAGAAWWWQAAPAEPADDRLHGWQRTAEQLLPESGEQQMSNTLALGDGDGHEEVAAVGSGEFLVSVVCAGVDGSRVRVSLGEGETGRGMRCSGSRTPEVFSVGLASELHLRVNVEAAGPVVFRYTLQRLNW
ncbi:hypothetical protein ACTI_17640 [Actinoplanes sp. OR16]|uniref:DUF6023 family protein n=1 Tax=Actinoplanes sp. OR16 TaxID=946334 RepID=UPI000F6F5357|nr:DUF6023 family protein [Actinoplanes sp. OR16]BBH65079.1 hypothetical protein ACTI_17640 [Actinoplanes sp. OR16]